MVCILKYVPGPLPSSSLYGSELTHPIPLDKMAANLADVIFKCIFLNENDRIPIPISLKFVPRIPIDNTPELVQVMAWRRTGDKREREREIKFIGLFENRGHRGPYSPYKPFNHNLYIGIIIFPHIDNPQYTGYDLPKKKPNKIINETRPTLERRKTLGHLTSINRNMIIHFANQS